MLRRISAAVIARSLLGRGSSEEVRVLDGAAGDGRVPVVWLLGKAQSGKSSVVAAVTGTDKAAVGEGFRPCTRTVSRYPFPEGDRPLLDFLDTRGLSEAGYDPGADVAEAAAASHLLFVVVRAADADTSELREVVRRARAGASRLPALLVLTRLHDLYPSGGGHVLPYPFAPGAAPSPLPPVVPDAVSGAVAARRAEWEGLVDGVVPVDFTKPADRLDPPDYGREALLRAADALLPEAVWRLLRDAAGPSLADLRLARARPVILAYSAAAAAAAALPLPAADVPVLVGLEYRLLRALTRLFGVELGGRAVAEVTAALGAGTFLRLAGRETLKFIPGGSVMAPLYAASLTYGLGHAFSHYLLGVRDGARPSREELRAVYDRHVAHGRTLFGQAGRGDRGP